MDKSSSNSVMIQRQTQLQKNESIIKKTMHDMGMSPIGLNLTILMQKCRKLTEQKDIEDLVIDYIKKRQKGPTKNGYRQMAKMVERGNRSSDVPQCVKTCVKSTMEQKIDLEDVLSNPDYCIIRDSHHVLDTEKNLVTSHEGRGLRVKYCGPVGISGYATAAKSYFYSLYICDVDISFHPIQLHAWTTQNDSKRDIALRTCLEKDIDPHVVILHSIPDMWPELVEREKKKHPNAKMVGFTVWESNRIHPKWVQCMQYVDLILSPCEWNDYVFARDSKKKTICLHNPIDQIVTDPDDIVFLEGVNPQDCVFYTIGEWNNRKGIEDLIQCFVESFCDNQNVVLYLKCCHIDRRVGEDFIESVRSRCKNNSKNPNDSKNPPRIILDTRNLKDSEIATIHKRGDVYVSLTRSEGTALGALEALTMGNPVIITAYGGQLDYLKSGVYYVSFHEETPIMCTNLRPGHENCKPNLALCSVYPWYLPNQMWGRPNLQDAIRTMRFVYENLDKCKQQVELGQSFLQQNYNSQVIGYRFIKILNSLLRE